MLGKMSSLGPRLALGALVAALGVGTIAADPARAAPSVTSAFGPTDDATVVQDAPNVNDGANAVLTATGTPSHRKVIYLRFNVTGVPPGATGVTATLRLNRTDHHLPADVTARTVGSTAWSEGTITFSNAPPLGPALGTVHPDRSSSTVSFPATDVKGGNRAYSYALTTSVTNDTARFWSDEGTTTVKPTLTVQYMPPERMWIGAAVNKPDTKPAAFAAADAVIGPLRYRRCFDAVLPTSYRDSCARGDADGGYRSFVSWKPPGGDFKGAAMGAYDAAVTSWARSVPATGVYATAFHEPENDMTGPQFVALQCHLYQVVKAANPSIRWGPVYMSYWWEPARLASIGGGDAWWVGPGCADFTGVDTYAVNPTPLRSDPEFRSWYDFMLGRGTPMVIAEYGQYVVPPGATPDPAKLAGRAGTIRLDAAWLQEQGVIKMWLYWDGTGPKGDWSLTDPASQRAWRDVATAGRAS